MAWVYILECADGSYYVGSAKNLDRRLDAHAAGTVPGYTATRLPVTLAWAQECEHVGLAYELERKLHGWSRAKKQALINGRLSDLPGLSRRRPKPGG